MLINRKLLWLLIIFAIAVNALGLFQPLLRNDDSVLYANIAKHIAISGDWMNLFSSGAPWLDKPHFPFWVTATFFKIFGINSFAYNFAGFIFNLIGVLYTYRLTKLLYNKDVALIASLLCLTSIHLMMSASVDVRAEAYLLGEIIPACYYWLKYDNRFNWQALLLGSLFTALAMMSKGIFVIVTIFSGLICTWLYTGNIRKIISPKWLIAYFLSLLFILPELISLYLQFDLHPEVSVLGRNNISGLKWFFLDSQLDRFFNIGVITRVNGNPLFFVHTYLWAFLPWSIVFIIAMVALVKNFKTQDTVNKAKNIYLLSSFWLTFMMFSIAKFQLDHYTNIIMPFAAILCARYIEQLLSARRLALIQMILASILLIGCGGLLVYLFKLSWLSLYALLPLFVLVVVWRTRRFTYNEQIILLPTLAICIIFGFLMLVNYVVCRNYDVGYNLATMINDDKNNANLNVYALNMSLSPVEFHIKNNVYKVYNRDMLPASGKYLVLIREGEFIANLYNLDKTQFTLKYKFCGNSMDKIIPYYMNKVELSKHLECFLIINHN